MLDPDPSTIWTATQAAPVESQESSADFHSKNVFAKKWYIFYIRLQSWQIITKISKNLRKVLYFCLLRRSVNLFAKVGQRRSAHVIVTSSNDGAFYLLVHKQIIWTVVSFFFNIFQNTTLKERKYHTYEVTKNRKCRLCDSR